MDYGSLSQWIVPALAAAAAWGGSRQALNGTRERVKDIDNKMDNYITTSYNKHENLVQRVAVVETKVDSLSQGD
jgi:hypothetical protein